MGLPLLPDLDLDPDFALSQLESALSGADDGELYLEHTKAQTLVYDDGRLKRASYDEDRGFGLRSVAGELTGYAHSDQVTEASLARAGETAAAAARSGGGTLALDPKRTNQRPYTDEDVIDAGPSFEKQVALAQTIDAHARAKDPRVRQVTVSLSTAHKDVTVLRPGGFRVSDSRPMSSMRVSVMLQDGDKREAGGFALGVALADLVSDLRPVRSGRGLSLLNGLRLLRGILLRRFGGAASGQGCGDHSGEEEGGNLFHAPQSRT